MLIDKLLKYDDLYYNTGTSPISDELYDELREKAREENPNHPYFMTVGSSVPGEKVKLPFILGSLNKIKPDTIEKWLDEHKGNIIASEKIDGVSIAVKYFNGKPIWAATRGDGYNGKNITDKAKIFCPEITYKAQLFVRGDCVILGDKYKELGFKTARNGCAGIINRDSVRNVEHITPIFYEVIDYSDSEYDRMTFLDIYFPNVATWFLMIKANKSVKRVREFFEAIKEDDLYEIDGVVLTPEKYVRENVLLPKNKVAYKENEEGVEATVVKIIWNTSRTGKIVPVIHIKPIELQGVTISKTTGFNAKFIIDNQIKEGSKVMIQRAGDVIPYIVI